MNNNELTESRIQSDCVIWLWNNYPNTRGFFCYNLANSKNAIDGNKNKAMGVIAGRSDCVLYWNSTAYMFEFKTEKGTQSKKQKEWQEIVEKSGYKYFIIRNLGMFKTTINNLIVCAHGSQKITL